MEMKTVEEKRRREFPDSLDGLKVVSENIGGSTGVQLVEDRYGNRYIRKTGGTSGDEPDAHIQSESRADAFYQAVRINVPEFRMYDRGGRSVKLSRFVPDGQSLNEWWRTHPNPVEREEMIRKIRVGFGTDAMIGNWDVIGMNADNILIDADGNPWRIDNGGSLDFRAQGARKKKGDFGFVPTDIWSMRSSGNNRRFFSGISTRDALEQIVQTDWESAMALLNNSESVIVCERVRIACLLFDHYKAMENAGFSENRIEERLLRLIGNAKKSPCIPSVQSGEYISKQPEPAPDVQSAVPDELQ
jgi:hypothetical protein